MTATASLRLEPLDLSQTLGCGQTFRWRPLADGSWSGPLGGHLVTLSKVGPDLCIKASPGGPSVRKMVSDHLRSDDDIPAIQRSLARLDPVLANGMRRLRGLRIVKMDEWECLISLMLATYANIPRISKMIDALARRYGRRIVDDTYSFPTLERMKKAELADLSGCGLGYRARYVHSVCQLLDDGAIDRLKRLPYRKLREELTDLPGVGDKVADCVALFGFGRLESFPIDVWMERALRRLYGQNGSYGKLAAFAHERFGAYAGYAQEYLYYNERAHAPNGSCLFSQQTSDR